MTRDGRSWLYGVMLLAGAALLFFASSASALTYTVDQDPDVSDATPGDGVCSDGTGAPNCSLRAAIEESNATAADDEIAFNVLGRVNTASSSWPTITDKVTLDGCLGNTPASTTPCAHVNTFTAGTDGLRVTGAAANGTTIRGLAIYGFTRAISNDSANSSLTVKNDYFGLFGPGGMFGLEADNANGIGVLLQGNSSTVGGTAAGDRNVFANHETTVPVNNGVGVRIDGGDNNTISGNYFGVNASGSTAEPQTSNIEIKGTGPAIPTGTVIGGTLDMTAAGTAACDGACNLIANATGPGIDLDIGAAGEEAGSTSIRGNYVGLGLSGSGASGNALGVDVGDADDVTMGGVLGTDSNLIAGNSVGGIRATTGSTNLNLTGNRYGLDYALTASVPNAGVQVEVAGGAVVYNSFIAGGTGATGGVLVTGDGSEITGSAIGYDDAQVSRPFDGPAVEVRGDNNVIGKVNGMFEDGNSITGAADPIGAPPPQPGLLILNGSGNTVEANAIGTTSKMSNNDRGNAGAGVRIESTGVEAATGNRIGGDSDPSENNISFNDLDAVEVVGAASDDNEVARNFGHNNGATSNDLFLDLGDQGFGDTAGVNNGIDAPVGFVATDRAAGLGEPGATVRSYEWSPAGPIGGPSSRRPFAGSATADSRGLYQVVYSTTPNASLGLTTDQTTATDGTSEADQLGALHASNATPPVVDVTGPSTTTDTTPTFNFADTSADLGSDLEIFVCAFDSDPYQFCTDQPTYTPSTALSVGAHTITVNAIDSGANIDATEDTLAFTVQAAPSISTQATASATVGQQIGDEATLAGGSTPTGDITFTAFGPNDPTCAGPAAFTSAAVPVSGNGVYSTSGFAAPAAGAYRWIASYSGDANNAAVAGLCNDPNETSTVSAVITIPPTLTPAVTAATTPVTTVAKKKCKKKKKRSAAAAKKKCRKKK